MKHLLTSIFVIFSISLFSQDGLKHNVSVELDPAAFILKGYSVSLKYIPKSLEKVAFMMSIYKSNFPDAMMKKVNVDKGWTELKFNTSFAAFVEFYLKKKRKGFYFGPSIFLYNKNVKLKTSNKKINFSSIYPNFRIGYIWYPFRGFDLYLTPWLNVGSEISMDDNNVVNDIEFELNSFNYIVALHVGYSMKF